MSGKRVYITGPISERPGLNRAAFEEAAARLRRLGFEPVNPLENGVPEDAPHEEHMRADIRLLLDCAGVYRLAGWSFSRGCECEERVREALGLPHVLETNSDGAVVERLGR